MKTSLPRFTALLLLAGSLGAYLPGCASTPTRESTGEYVDDSTLTTKVKAALIGDDAVKAFDIHVHTFKGAVQLSGFVNDPGQKDQAGRDASGVAGVKDVQNNISLK